MNKRYYIVDKANTEIIHGYIDYDKIKGFNIKPQNNIPYDGIEVGHLTLVEPELIEKVLKRKTKRKLNAYLNFLLSVIDDEESDGDALEMVIEDAIRYKAIIINKYSKFLDKKYLNILLRKVNIVEKELKAKLIELYREDEIQIGRKR